VQIRLQKALLALTQIAPKRFSALAALHAERALSRCQANMLPYEMTALKAVADRITNPQTPTRARPI
jgi:hypothetical protein